ncbi:permease prefix domain 1-containing protein [Anaerorhabdus sp.]|uniref:permease prefix domain 1-containing protein n=1 Tax=Anaerorhabdus sp. TaxID=1872524 RepID=UPI002FCCAC4F
MNSKIRNYVDVIFKDVPRTKKAIELKEEIASNLNERFEDYLKEGKSETESYGLAVANMGDVDEMIREVMPNEDFVIEANSYRKRNAKNTAIGVCLYILGAAALILFSVIGEEVGMEDVGGAVGVITLLIFAAIATAMIVYSYMSTPKEYKDYEDSQEREIKSLKPKDRKVFEAISSIYWLIITAIYLLISFVTHAWGITWIIWVISGIFHQIIVVIFQLKGTNE